MLAPFLNQEGRKEEYRRRIVRARESWEGHRNVASKAGRNRLVKYGNCQTLL